MERLESRHLLATGDWLGGAGEGEPAEAEVAFRLQVADLSGAPIDRTGPGTDVLVQVFVRDVRPNVPIPGVFAAYLDVRYDAELLTVVLASDHPLGFDIEFSPFYQNGQRGDAGQAGLIDEVGAFQTGFSPLGAGEVLLFQTRFTAGEVQLADDVFAGIHEDQVEVVLDVLANDSLRLGTAWLTGDPADRSPAHDVVLFAPPEAVPDARQRFAGTQLSITDSGGTLITAVGTPSHGGEVRVAPDGSHLIYTPAPNFFGTESFTYRVGHTQTATVWVIVDPVNDPPSARDDYYSTGGNQPLLVSASRGVLVNDEDVDGDVLTALLVSPAEQGMVELHPDGGFVYTPPADFRGTDRFRYVAFDGELTSNVAEVVIEVGLPRVSIRLEVTDQQGEPREELANGEPIWLRAWVRDLRTDSHSVPGVQAGYLDVLFDPEQVLPLLNEQLPLGFVVEFGPGFDAAQTGAVVLPGRIDEIGARQVLAPPLDREEQLLFAMPFSAAGPRLMDDSFLVSFQSQWNVLDVLANDREVVWTVEWIAEPADRSPESDVRLFDPSAPVPVDETIYEAAQVVLRNDDTLRVTAAGPSSQGGVVVVAADGRRVMYSPPRDFEGVDSFSYWAVDRRGSVAEAMVSVEVRRSWQNLHWPLDVNSDTQISPIDALLVINDLNTHGFRPLSAPSQGPPFIDVNGDGFVSPLDALLVINYWNTLGPGEGESGHGDHGEGESTAGGQSGGPHGVTAGASGGSWGSLDALFPSSPPALSCGAVLSVERPLRVDSQVGELVSVGRLPQVEELARYRLHGEFRESTPSLRARSLDELLSWIFAHPSDERAG